jgi:hypothetical protein
MLPLADALIKIMARNGSRAMRILVVFEDISAAFVLKEQFTHLFGDCTTMVKTIFS